MDLGEVKLHLVDDFATAEELMRWLGERRTTPLGLDTETGGLDMFDGLRLVQFGDLHHGWAVPWERWSGLVHDVLARYDGGFVLHNAKFDLNFMAVNGLPLPSKIDDTRILSHLVDPTGSHGLKALAMRLVDRGATAGQDLLKEAMKKNQWTWKTVPYDFTSYWAYAALDTVLTVAVWEALRPNLPSIETVYQLELHVQDIVGAMERKGAKIDVRYTYEEGDRYETYAREATEWVQQTYGIRPTSNVEVSRKLLEEGVPLTKLTAGGAHSVDKEVLESLDHPLAQVVLNIRNAEKIAHTYFRRFIEMERDSLLHPSINILGARTGRMSINAPPLQTLPRGASVRDCFVPRDGNALILADFDQIELRLMAHFANEDAMIRAIHSGLDLHTYTAQLVFGLGDHEPTKQQRQIAKSANFSKIYGAGVHKFALTTGVDVEVARAFLERYDAMFPGVRRFQQQVEQTVNQRMRDEGRAYVRSPIGRMHPSDGDAHYKLVNYLIQGTAADVLKLKLAELDLAGLGEYMILPVHDEVVFDVPLDVADEVERTINEVMHEGSMFSVPLTVGIDRVQRWGDKYRD